MINLINRLFSGSQIESIIKLWQDKNSRLLIEKEIGKHLLESDEVLSDSPFNQLLVITSLSPFASSDDERQSVAHIIYWGIKRGDMLPLCTEHQGKELAYRCLISLGFFKKALIERYKRHSAPSPDFYRDVGINAFNQARMIEIGNHFYKWEIFINDIFV